MASKADQVKRGFDGLLEAQSDDQRLLDHLVGFIDAQAATFSSLTWYWGPRLYERNRVVFRSTILTRFSEWGRDGFSPWKRITWKSHADELEPWLAAVRANRDTTLTRRLLRWKFASRSWGVDSTKWCQALLAEYAAASSAAARVVVLDEFDEWFDLTEDVAVQLYTIDRNSQAFILKHLPGSTWGGEKRQMWSKLDRAAEEAGDHAFRMRLYRKLAPIKQWESDVLALADRLRDSEALNHELDEHHPEGWGLRRGGVLLALLEKRGRDVMPYVMRHLAESVGGYYGESTKKFVSLARSNEWWDLWASAIRASRDARPFNAAVMRSLGDGSLASDVKVVRLKMLVGVSREWNFPGLGFAQIHSLDDAVAVALYEQYPDLIRGPFRAHVLPRWWQGMPKLLDTALSQSDEELIDILASRYVTHASYRWAWGSSRTDEIMQTAERLGTYFEEIRERDDIEFARRAANVLTRVPSYAIFSFPQLLKTNRLARLLFVRSSGSFLASDRAVQDLVESSDIHVQMLAYRVLAQDDPRARTIGLANLDLLLATLLRPLHRKTRLPAFDALANAGRADEAAAKRILARCRDALSLPDTKYPKEQLIGLIARLLDAHPSLRSPAEQPMVYGLVAAQSEVAA